MLAENLDLSGAKLIGSRQAISKASPSEEQITNTQRRTRLKCTNETAMPKMATEQPQTVSHFVLKLCIPRPHGIFPHATSALFNTPRAFVPVLYWLYIFVVAINLRPLFQSLLGYHHACLVLASFTIYYQPILAGPVDHSAQLI